MHSFHRRKKFPKFWAAFVIFSKLPQVNNRPPMGENSPILAPADRQNVEKMSKKCRKNVEKMSKKCRKNVEKMSKKCRKNVE
jgi:hypothetical protein